MSPETELSSKPPAELQSGSKLVNELMTISKLDSISQQLQEKQPKKEVRLRIPGAADQKSTATTLAKPTPIISPKIKLLHNRNNASNSDMYALPKSQTAISLTSAAKRLDQIQRGVDSKKGQLTLKVLPLHARQTPTHRKNQAKSAYLTTTKPVKFEPSQNLVT